MATYTLGQAAIVNKGAYSSSASYAVLNQVTNLGGSWLCKAACSNVEPGVTSGWANYWTPASMGIKNVTVSSSGNTNTMIIAFSDGTTTSFPYPTTVIADLSISAVKLADDAVTTRSILNGNVTAAKLASDVNYAAIGLTANQVRTIYSGETAPESSFGDNGDIFVLYTIPPEPEEEG